MLKFLFATLLCLVFTGVASADTRVYVSRTNFAVPRWGNPVYVVVPGNYNRYARTQGRLSFQEWAKLHSPKPYRKSDYDVGDKQVNKPYVGGPVTVVNHFVKTPEVKIRRVVNPDGSETVYNPYCE